MQFSNTIFKQFSLLLLVSQTSSSRTFTLGGQYKQRFIIHNIDFFIQIIMNTAINKYYTVLSVLVWHENVYWLTYFY